MAASDAHHALTSRREDRDDPLERDAAMTIEAFRPRAQTRIERARSEHGPRVGREATSRGVGPRVARLDGEPRLALSRALRVTSRARASSGTSAREIGEVGDRRVRQNGMASRATRNHLGGLPREGQAPRDNRSAFGPPSWNDEADRSAAAEPTASVHTTHRAPWRTLASRRRRADAFSTSGYASGLRRPQRTPKLVRPMARNLAWPRTRLVHAAPWTTSTNESCAG